MLKDIKNGCYQSPDGSIEWYVNNVLHRIGEPAKITKYGLQEWFIDGKRHRDDGPAFIMSDYKEWWQYGKLHRSNAPAIVWEQGNQQSWFYFGQLHCLEGPAIRKCHHIEWWIFGKSITTNVIQWQQQIDIPHWSQWTDTEKTLFRLTFQGT